MKIAIVCPIYITNAEHKRYLDLTTKSFVSVDHDLVFIPVENYVAPEFRPLAYAFDHVMDHIEIVKGRQPQGVAKAWNDGIARAKEIGCDYVLVINSDIVFKSNMIDRLVTFAEKFNDPAGVFNDVVMWTAAAYSDLTMLEESPEDENCSEHPHFSCFMVKPDFFDHVGKFDENFMPAYLEDGDCHARLALANLRAIIYGGARFYHFGSRVIKSDRQAWESNTQTFPKNQEYFLRKWGHPPVNEVAKMREVYYKHPYNDESKSLDYWQGIDEELSK